MKKSLLLVLLSIITYSCSKGEKENSFDSNYSSRKNTVKSSCDCSESDARRIANSMITEIENAQFNTNSEDFVDVSIDNMTKNSDCTYTVTFKIQNNGERVAGWNTAKTISKTIRCR